MALTRPTTYSWSPQGQRVRVPYQAPQGRRAHVIGAYVTPGPEAGRLEYRSWAVLLKSRARTPRTTPEERAAAQGLRRAAGGPIAARLVAVLGQGAGRPAEAASDWRRACPLVRALDHDAVPTSQSVLAAQPQWAAATVEVVYLARSCPAPSGLEPVWNDVKQHPLPIRSFAHVADLKHAVDDALARTAQHLQHAHGNPTNLQRLAA